jgi:hypothetical protein
VRIIIVGARLAAWTAISTWRKPCAVSVEATIVTSSAPVEMAV